MSWLSPETRGKAPDARAGHSITQCGNKIYVFGGFSGSLYLNDVYIFDSDTFSWSRPAVSGIAPVARVSHTATCIRNRIFVFGGTDGSGYRNDLCVLATEDMAWSRPACKGKIPEARAYHSSIAVDGKIYFFGGFNGSQYLNDLHVLDVDNVAWTKPKVFGMPPPAREGHTVAAIGNKLYVFGGQSGRRSLNDLYVLNLDTMGWYGIAIITDETPCARFFHTSGSLSSDIIVFGGDDGRNGCLNDLHVLDADQLSWTKVNVTENLPPPRSAHAACVVGSRCFVFGGHDGYRCLNDMYYIDIRSITLRKKADTVRKSNSGVQQRSVPSLTHLRDLRLQDGEEGASVPLISPRFVVRWLSKASQEDRAQFAEMIHSLLTFKQQDKGPSSTPLQPEKMAGAFRELTRCLNDMSSMLSTGSSSQSSRQQQYDTGAGVIVNGLPVLGARRTTPRSRPVSALPELEARPGSPRQPLPQTDATGLLSGLRLEASTMAAVQDIIQREVQRARTADPIRPRTPADVPKDHQDQPRSLLGGLYDNSQRAGDEVSRKGTTVAQGSRKMSRQKSKLLNTLEDALQIIEQDPTESPLVKERRAGFIQNVMSQVRSLSPTVPSPSPDYDLEMGVGHQQRQ